MSPMKNKNMRESSEADPTWNAEIGMQVIRLDGVDPAFRNALRLVIAISATLFVLQMATGHYFGSHVLQADALDYLDDTATYALSLVVVGASIRTRAGAMLLRAAIVFAMSLCVVGSTAYHAIWHTPVLTLPRPEIVGAIGLFGLMANMACRTILAPHIDSDANIRADGLNIRHDIAGNIAVIVSAAAVWVIQSPWPDLVLALFASGQWLHLSILMLRESAARYRASKQASND